MSCLVLRFSAGHFADLVQGAVHLDAGEALALQLRQLLAVLALAVPHDGRQQQQARALRHRHHAVHHLADGLGLDGFAGSGGVGDAGARPEQAHVVVDFGDGADGAARVAAGGLLLDGDGRGQALDAVHVGLAHQLQELPGVGGEGLDVAALALGVDGVEGEGGLAGAGQAGDDGQAVARDVHVDVLEVVLARAAHADVAGHAVQSLSGRAASLVFWYRSPHMALGGVVWNPGGGDLPVALEAIGTAGGIARHGPSAAHDWPGGHGAAMVRDGHRSSDGSA